MVGYLPACTRLHYSRSLQLLLSNQTFGNTYNSALGGQFGRFFQTSSKCCGRENDNYGGFLKVSDEVSEAIRSRKAVVALESTIITHGMPYPHNFSTALSVERRVRDNGAVPATVAVLNGKLCVGVNDTDLLWLAEKTHNLVKVSRRDLSYVLSQGLSGGTTVSATMIAAHMAGIPIFATGGIGGVHRGAETSFDVSADLTELGQTPVTVVSSGVKSILDIPKTLEYLETQGVSVATFGTDKNFPAFFTSDSGHMAPFNVTSHLEAASLIDTQMRLGLQSGSLIAVPIPEEFAAAGEMIQSAINEAVELAREHNVSGKQVTPYVLNIVNQLTEGESLMANIALVENNASVAGGIANCLSQIQNGVPLKNIKPPPLMSPVSLSSSPALRSAREAWVTSFKKSVDGTDASSEISQTTLNKLSGRPVVIGTAVVDFNIQVQDPNLQFNGATYPGKVSQSFGGVGRNLADCLSRLDRNPVFVSAIGTDSHASAMLAYCSHMDMQAVQRIDDVSTATSAPILLADGQHLFGVIDMEINMRFDASKVSGLDEMIKSAPIAVLDGNSTPKSIEDIVNMCVKADVPVWFEPTDLYESKKPFETDAWRHLTFISPNLGELVSMHEAMSSTLKQQPAQDAAALSENDDLKKIVQVSVKLCRDLVTYIPVILLTLGKHGVLLCHCFGDVTHLLPLPVSSENSKELSFKATYYPALDPDLDSSSIVSVSGAGD